MNLNDQFKNMTPAQKTFVLSMLVNKVLQNPTDYGLNNNGILNIGDKLNLIKLFENAEEVKSILDKAKQTIIEGGPQEKSILANNEKIADWIKNNPDVKLTNDRVTDILSNKPKVETVSEPMGEIHEPKIITGPIPRFQKSIDQDIPNKIPDEILNKLPDDFGGKTTLAAGIGEAGISAVGALDKQKIEQTQKEIEDAKNRLTEIESNIRNPNLERTFASDSNFTQGIEMAFRKEINDIYGKSGFLGMGRIAGMDTKEWGEMAKLPASKVVEYYTGDSTKSGLTAEVVEKLSKSSKHNTLMKQVVGLMDQSNRTVKPYENESVEQFIRRLGGYVLRTHQESLPKAA